MYIPVPKSLSPGVNLRLYHYSTETETHIYFIPKIAETFDLLGFSRQKADCLNVRWKLLLILNSETVVFCEKVHAPLRGIAFTPAKTTYFFVLSILISFNGNDLNNFSTFFAKVSNSSICLSNISASSLASSANSANALLAALIALST